MKSILETEGVTSSQVSVYMMGGSKVKKGEPYSSKKHINCYINGHQTNSDDSDWIICIVIIKLLLLLSLLLCTRLMRMIKDNYECV